MIKILENSIDFSKLGNHTKEELKSRIDEKINGIDNAIIKTMVMEIMKENEKDFYEYPAATKNHHDFVGGLATHVLGMLELGHSICALYPMLNEDLLAGGIILHDIGKLTELNKAIISEYTKTGKLLGHISIMQAMVYEKAKQLGYENEEEIGSSPGRFYGGGISGGMRRQ